MINRDVNDMTDGQSTLLAILLAQLRQETTSITAVSASPRSGCLLCNKSRMSVGQETFHILSEHSAEAEFSMSFHRHDAVLICRANHSQENRERGIRGSWFKYRTLSPGFPFLLPRVVIESGPPTAWTAAIFWLPVGLASRESEAELPGSEFYTWFRGIRQFGDGLKVPARIRPPTSPWTLDGGLDPRTTFAQVPRHLRKSYDIDLIPFSLS
jgi:hypothetical protein